MQEFIATLAAFALAALGLSVGILCGRIGLRVGCQGRKERDHPGGCGRPDCCSAGHKPELKRCQH